MSHLIDSTQAIKIIQRTIKKYSKNGKTNIKAVYDELIEWSYNYCKERNVNLEYLIPILALLLNIWSCWILESKTICHYRKAGHITGYRNIRDSYILNLKESIIEARNIALKEKRVKKAQGDHEKDDELPSYIKIPDDYDESSIFSIDRPEY